MWGRLGGQFEPGGLPSVAEPMVGALFESMAEGDKQAAAVADMPGEKPLIDGTLLRVVEAGVKPLTEPLTEGAEPRPRSLAENEPGLLCMGAEPLRPPAELLMRSSAWSEGLPAEMLLARSRDRTPCEW